MKKFNEFLGELKNPKEIKDFQEKSKKEKFSIHNYVDAFKKYGFEIMGIGSMGSVFGNSKYPYVIKIFRTDQGYLSFIKWVSKNQGNKYIPKVKGKVLRISDDHFSVRIEKLKKFDKSDEAWEFLDICDNPEKFLHDLLNLKYFSIEDKDLIKLCKFLISNEARGGLDIYEGNIMMKGRNPVLIDPLKGYDTTKYGKGKIKFRISQFEEQF